MATTTITAGPRIRITGGNGSFDVGFGGTLKTNGDVQPPTRRRLSTDCRPEPPNSNTTAKCSRPRFADFRTIDRYYKKYFISAGYQTPKFVPPHLRHNSRLSFGLELETVIEGCDESGGYQVMLECLKQLYHSGGVIYDAQILDDRGPDRTKFLIMADNSINYRLYLKDGVEIPYLTEEAQLSPEDETASEFGDWGWGEKGDGQEDNPERENQQQQDENNMKGDKKEKIHFSDIESLGDSCFKLGAPVEFCTPILGQITYQPVILSVFSYISQNLVLHFNDSTGLHVHVGCGNGSSWSLEELKAIGKATILWEVVIDQMHAPHRGKGNWMIASNRWNSELRDRTLSDAFRKIDKAKDFAKFYKRIGKEKFFKYNFSANCTYGTIEFRQAEAYATGEKAVEWIRFISWFVSASLTVYRWEWEKWAEEVGWGRCAEELLVLDEEVWKRFGIPTELHFRIAGAP